MCPRGATVEHGGAAMPMSSAQSFREEEYIDLDLSSCGEYEFRVCRSRAAAAPCAEETLCRGSRMHRVAPRPGGKPAHAEATVGSGGRRSTATVAPLQQHSHVRSAQPARAHAEGRRKAVRAKLQASRDFFRSLFARTSCSDHERCHGGTGVPCPSGSISGGKKAPFGQIKSGGAGPTTLRRSIEQEKEEEEQAASIRQRKSFSGVIRWRPLATTARSPTLPPPHVSSTRRKSCGSAPAALKRSSSCRSEAEAEPEGLIQGAIAYCKRTQQQQQQRVLARKSVSDAALCSS